jgi:hypothetical protein
VRVGNEGPRPQNNDYNKLILKINEVPIVKKSKAKIQKAYMNTITTRINHNMYLNHIFALHL